MCLITPFKDKKVATQDMIVYKALYPHSSVEKTITEKKWFGLKKTTKIIEVPSFESEHMSYKYIVGELQPKVEMVTNNEYRASTELEWIRVRKYAEEYFGFCGDEDLWNGEICNFVREHEAFICVSKGYHSYADLETAKEAAREGSMSHGLVKCIIPAGSEYYEGFGFLVSDQIIVTGERITE